MTPDKSARRRTLVYFGALWGVAIVFMIVQARFRADRLDARKALG